MREVYHTGNNICAVCCLQFKTPELDLIQLSFYHRTYDDGISPQESRNSSSTESTVL